MIFLLKILIISAAISVALGLAIATGSAARGRRIGRRVAPPVDPYFYAFGDMPNFTRADLETIARRPVELHHQSTSAVTATPVGQGSGSVVFLSDAAAAYHRRHLRG